MDLYKFHTNPETLHGHNIAYETVPELVYNIAKSGKKLTDKQEDAIAKDPKYAYRYAYYVLDKPFPNGEDAISKDPVYAHKYACDVLKKPFPRGEDAITKDSYYAYKYAISVLKKPWPKGEDAISKDSFYSYYYARDILKLSEAKARKWPK